MGAKARQILDMNAYRGGAEGAGREPLLRRRLANMGPASVLFYQQPIEMVRGRGCWMEAADGTRYLDFYNNVPSVGHCHPGVVEAVSRQLAELNVNSRYLHATVETYLERLRATFPPALSHVVLCCSGSEANDLAMRVAIKATGHRGFIVTEGAYHGNTMAVTDISPASWKRGAVPHHVRLVPAPTRAAYGDDIASGFANAVAEAATDLDRARVGLAGFICDSVFSSDGIHADPAGFLAPAVAAARAAGGIYVADEVQPGFGRTGAGLWGFARHGVEPDIVTMGKPMGNGFPIAGLALRAPLLESFCADTGYFNTFGATPAAAAAGLAVLDAIEQVGLVDNARQMGSRLMAGLSDLARTDPRMVEVRGAGLFIGVELGGEAGPDGRLAGALIERLRQRRVLIGAAGRHGETLKLRPPLCLDAEEAGFFLDAMAWALESERPRGRRRTAARRTATA
ncbi:MAG: aminotransferase class III-fold pyridoxal phosphate-dependent enzyme [Geminicoccaceae bacterium]